MHVSGKALLLAALFASPVAIEANAASPCSQASLTGSWQVYSITHQNSTATPSRCQVAVKANGSMTGQCFYANGDSSPLSAAAVKMTSSATCGFTGKFTLDGNVDTIKVATLATDGLTGVGFGTISGGGFFTFQILKLP
jgi:hypothetical protein